MSAPVLPIVTELNAPFWDGCAAGVLRLQRCAACALLRYPIAPWCPNCLEDGAEWAPMSGRGTVVSALGFHHAYHPAWAARLPYNVVLVQLDEGPRMISNVTPLSRLDIPVGTPVEVVFENEHDVVIPRFRVIESRTRRK